jgi:TIR domain-containing protein
MSETFEYDVFLSHSSRDKPAVRELAQRLRADGLRVWLDEWVIRPGDMIGLKVEQGLERSRTLVLVMSASSFASEWATLERHTAMFRDPTNAQRRFIPLRLDDAEIKDTLKQFAYVDWRERTHAEYAKLLESCRPPVLAIEPPVEQKAYRNQAENLKGMSISSLM